VALDATFGKMLAGCWEGCLL